MAERLLARALARGWVAGRMVYGWERDRRQEMSEWGRQNRASQPSNLRAAPAGRPMTAASAARTAELCAAAAEGIGDGARRDSTKPFQHRVRVSAGVATRSPEIAAVWKRRCALHGQPPGSHAQRAGRDGRTHALQTLPEETAGGERKTRDTAGPAQRARLVVHGVPAGHRMGAFERAVVFSGCPV